MLQGKLEREKERNFEGALDSEQKRESVRAVERQVVMRFDHMNAEERGFCYDERESCCLVRLERAERTREEWLDAISLSDACEETLIDRCFGA